MDSGSKGQLMDLSTTPDTQSSSAQGQNEPVTPKETVTSSGVSHISHPRNLHVLLFGDQTAASDLLAHIKDLYQQSSRSYSLRTFLQNTTDALQSSIVELSPSERKHFPDFQSILGLVQDSVAGDVVLSTILFCIAQLGSLIM